MPRLLLLDSGSLHLKIMDSTVGEILDLPLETPAKSGVNMQALNERDSRWAKVLTSTALIMVFASVTASDLTGTR